ncbi:uncharacterized protein LOC113798348 [Dermatophagoides pteronyssinus]|uniref:Uncharacterized protein n=2 Tax=Dermatophagoides pteronyssinus TaxID=6956 RepID=A0ABQ8J097_DERPT|nr:uncharacterized protein LOC113798348 [Dermatophagoides pteronyssinus]KAH9415985.1 hypothetical protein DERP_000480 [Dermatophagoides pteronyssinus]
MYQLKSITFFTTIVAIFVMVESASRQPNQRDHLHCKMEYFNEWEEMMQTADPYAVVESFHDIHGSPCKTPCRLRSPSNPALTTVLGERNSPNYETCGSQKFCFEGTCVSKRFQI